MHKRSREDICAVIIGFVDTLDQTRARAHGLLGVIVIIIVFVTSQTHTDASVAFVADAVDDLVEVVRLVGVHVVSCSFQAVNLNLRTSEDVLCFKSS